MEYLIGKADDPRNWGDYRTTRGGVWSALEKIVAPAYRAQFIFMQRLITEEQVEISMYLHEATGTMVLVDDEGQSYKWFGNGLGLIQITMQEARTRLVEALLDALDREVDEGMADRARDISHYRPTPRRASLMAGNHWSGAARRTSR